jgi:hypothetical protein
VSAYVIIITILFSFLIIFHSRNKALIRFVKKGIFKTIIVCKFSVTQCFECYVLLHISAKLFNHFQVVLKTHTNKRVLGRGLHFTVSDFNVVKLAVSTKSEK